jgi:hypothetical protein
MSNPDPFNFAQAWDSIQIGLFTWGGPSGFFGKIQIKGATRFYKIDQKDGQGLDGATQTYRGQKPKPFKLVFSWGFQNLTPVTPAQQHAYWVLFSAQFNYTGSKLGLPPPVYQVYHPGLQLLGIGAILVEEVGMVEIDERTNIASSTVGVRQFYPVLPAPSTSTPVGATGDVNQSGYLAGETQQNAQNAALEAQIQAERAAANAGVAGAFPH